VMGFTLSKKQAGWCTFGGSKLSLWQISSQRKTYSIRKAFCNLGPG